MGPDSCQVSFEPQVPMGTLPFSTYFVLASGALFTSGQLGFVPQSGCGVIASMSTCEVACEGQ